MKGGEQHGCHVMPPLPLLPSPDRYGGSQQVQLAALEISVPCSPRPRPCTNSKVGLPTQPQLVWMPPKACSACHAALHRPYCAFCHPACMPHGTHGAPATMQAHEKRRARHANSHACMHRDAWALHVCSPVCLVAGLLKPLLCRCSPRRLPLLRYGVGPLVAVRCVAALDCSHGSSVHCHLCHHLGRGDFHRHRGRYLLRRWARRHLFCRAGVATLLNTPTSKHRTACPHHLMCAVPVTCTLLLN